DLGPAGRAAAIREREILWAADVGSKHLLPVDEHDERVLRLDGAGIQADAEILERQPILAVRREHVLDPDAAARAERHALDVAALIRGRRREVRGRDLRHRLADGEVSRRAGKLEVLL